MEDTTLEVHFKNINDKLDNLSVDLKESDGRQRSQYRKVIIIEEHQKIMKKDIEDHKTNVRWGIGIIMPTITAVLLFIGNYFIPKSG